MPCPAASRKGPHAREERLPAYESLEPAAVWKFFAGISAHPRPSKKEERVRAHVEGVARALGLATRTDAAGNLVIEVPATPGREAAPVTVLQGHLDMVCEKNSGTAHDFDRDPIKLIVDRDAEEGRIVVRADGTTLGADNGIGLALALAAATSPEVTHGPLEILCTIDEEMGMGGAERAHAGVPARPAPAEPRLRGQRALHRLRRRLRRHAAVEPGRRAARRILHASAASR